MSKDLDMTLIIKHILTKQIVFIDFANQLQTRLKIIEQ